MSLTIHDLPLQDRPREKLSARGPQALSDSELLAILLRTGIPGANAVEVARQLLQRYGSLGNLARCTVSELSRVKGVGPAKAVQLVAAFGLGARLAREEMSRVTIDEPAMIYSLLAPEMQSLAQESLRLVLLDNRLRLLRIEEVFRGSASDCLANPRDIFRTALAHAASHLIVVHNHPSGDPTPSATDRQATIRLLQAAELLLLPLHDHIIIGRPSPAYPSGYVSMRESGLIQFP